MVSVSVLKSTAPKYSFTVQEGELLQAFRKIKNSELRGAVLSIVSNVNRKVR